MDNDSVQDIAPHGARDPHVCWARSHSVQLFLLRDYLDW